MKKPYISWRGNRKLPFATWNIPAGSTCPGKTPECCRTCYARKAERQFPAVLPSRKNNLEWSRRPEFVDTIVGLIHKHKSTEVFRIHESGDFYSPEYFRVWCHIAERCPNVQFFAFTKVFELFSIERPPNFALIASVYYDDPRPVPDGVPVFRTVPRGESGTGMHCLGRCDQCMACPFAVGTLEIWTEVH